MTRRRTWWLALAGGALLAGPASAAKQHKTMTQQEYIKAWENKANCEKKRAEAAIQQLDQTQQQLSQTQQQLDQANQQLAQAGQEPVEAGLLVRSNVFFPLDQSELNPDAQRHLEEIAQAAMQAPDAQVRIEAFTDSQGSAEHNLALSDERANSVKDFLVNQGVEESRIMAEGRGELQPIASNDTPEGRALNRRSEISVETGVGGAGQKPQPSYGPEQSE